MSHHFRKSLRDRDYAGYSGYDAAGRRPALAAEGASSVFQASTGVAVSCPLGKTVSAVVLCVNIKPHSKSLPILVPHFVVPPSGEGCLHCVKQLV